MFTLAFMTRALFTGSALWFCSELPGQRAKKKLFSSSSR